MIPGSFYIGIEGHKQALILCFSLIFQCQGLWCYPADGVLVTEDQLIGLSYDEPVVEIL